MLEKLNVIKIKSQLTAFLFYFIIFLAPFQKRFFLPNSFSFIENYFIEYNSFYISFPEILILLLLLINGKSILNNLIKILSSYKRLLVFFIITALTLLNIFNSINVFLSFHKIFHLLVWALFIFLGISFISNSKRLSSTVQLIIISSLLQSLIAISQFIIQGSLGLGLLGESLLAPDILGVAKIDFSLGKIIRAYGTEPHPNILGGFLLSGISFSFFYLAYLRKVRTECSTWNILKYSPISNCSTWNNLILNLKKATKTLLGFILKNETKIITSIILINSVALFFTFSRISIFLLFFFLSIMFFYKKKYLNKIIIISLGSLFVLLLIFLPLIENRWNEQGSFKDKDISLREIYLDHSKEIITKNPLLGSGAGTFILSAQSHNSFNLSPWELQPVHNMCLIAMSELGIVFVSILLFFLINFLFLNKKIVRPYFSNKILLIGFFLLLVSGVVDHYLYTLSQGNAILALFLIIIISNNKLHRSNNPPIVPRGTIGKMT